MHKDLIEFSQFKQGWFDNREDGQEFKTQDLEFADSICNYFKNLNINFILFPSPDNEITIDFQVEESFKDNWCSIDLIFNSSHFYIHNYNRVNNSSIHKKINFNNLEDFYKEIEALFILLKT
jgi:hypothetical protein